MWAPEKVYEPSPMPNNSPHYLGVSWHLPFCFTKFKLYHNFLLALFMTHPRSVNLPLLSGTVGGCLTEQPHTPCWCPSLHGLAPGSPAPQPFAPSNLALGVAKFHEDTPSLPWAPVSLVVSAIIDFNTSFLSIHI